MADIKRYDTDEIIAEYMYNGNMETACKSEDVDKLIIDHKAVVEAMQNKIKELEADILARDIVFKGYESKIEELEKLNKSLECCGNCDHPERSGDYCPYALTNVSKHHYCSNWTMYKILNTVQRGLNR